MFLKDTIFYLLYCYNLNFMVNYIKRIKKTVVIKIRGRKYSEEEILKQLRQYYSKNKNITSNGFKQDKNTCSSSTVENKFGSWQKALLKAGIPVTEKKELTKEKIIKQLQDHYLKNPKMSLKSFDEDKSVCSITTIKSKFGNWSTAVAEAGLILEGSRKLSNSDIIKQLQEYYSKNFHILEKSFSKDKNTCSADTIIARFGSWENALKEAGLPNKKERMKKEMLRQLKQHYSKNPNMTKNTFTNDKSVWSGSTVQKYFGTWENALIEAGIKEGKEYIEYDKEKLLLILKEKVKSGELRCKKDLEKINGIPSVWYIERTWSWKELTKKLRLDRIVREYTIQEIIEGFKIVKKKYGKKKKITLKIMWEETGITSGPIIKNFGSWTEFLELMKEKEEHIFRMSQMKHTDEELIEMYRNFSIEIGEEVYGAARKDLEDYGFPYSSGTLYSRFISPNKLRELAGFEVKRRSELRHTKQELKTMLYEEYKKYGRQLSQTEIMKNSNLPSVATILRYFQTSKISEVWGEVLKK